jgi:hypothetical protein
MAKHTIRGKMWDVRYVPNMRADGECDPPNKPGKEIRISRRCKGLRRLVVLLHEGIHAGLWDLDESVVEELAEDLGRLVWREIIEPNNRTSPPNTAPR